jgi:hypothetical protein
MAALSPLRSARKRVLASEYGRYGEQRAVQEDLSKPELDPVGEEEELKRAKEGGEWEDTGREEMRDTGLD